MEACGTSGMKAALNGVLHLSIMDGWWMEGFTGKNGWAFGEGEVSDNRDQADAEAIYEILEKEHSTIVRVSKEEISACAADADLAQKLGIDPGKPILKRKRLVYDPGNRPVEYNIGYYRGDSFTYTIESEREF